jgi:type IV pilus biogenesis/stability protein PilW
MSLIIDAIKTAQKLRCQEGKGMLPCATPHLSPPKKRNASYKIWMTIVFGLSGLLIFSFVWGRPTAVPLPTPQATQPLGLQEKGPDIPVTESKVQELPPPPLRKKKVTIPIRPLVKAKEESFFKPDVRENQATNVDPIGGAKPRLLRRGKEAPLRVNPEQAQAFRPGSRRVDSPQTTIETQKDGPALAVVLNKEESLPLPPSEILPATASLNLLAAEEKKEEVSGPSWSIKEEEGRKVNRASEVLIHFNRGVQLSNQRETAKAIQAYEKVLEIDPSYGEAYNNLGVLHQEMGNFEKARKSYQKAVDMNPHYEKALNNLGILYYLQGRYEESRDALQRALEINPHNVESLINLGILFKKRGQMEQAMESFQKALTLDPSRGEIHYNLGLAYEQAKKIQPAIEHYQAFLHLSAQTHSILVQEVRRHVNDLWKTTRGKN